MDEPNIKPNPIIQDNESQTNTNPTIKNDVPTNPISNGNPNYSTVYYVPINATSADVPTLKTAILTVKSYLWELIKRWYVYVICIGAFLLIAHWYIDQQIVRYTASASFMTNNDTGGGISSAFQLFGQITGGGGGGNELSSDKMVDLLLSKKIIYSALMRSKTLDGKDDLLINHYINLSGLRTSWIEKDNTELKNFRFTNKRPANFTLLENSVAKQIYESLSFGSLNINNTQYGIVRVKCTSVSDHFAVAFTQELVRRLKVYYESAAVEQKRKAYRILQTKADSMQMRLRQSEQSLASWIDQNKKRLNAGTLSGDQIVEKIRLENEAETIHEATIRAVEGKEVAYTDLLNNTPIIQVIDLPTLPLNPAIIDKKMVLMAATIAAMGLATVWIFFNKLIRDALRE